MYQPRVQVFYDDILLLQKKKKNTLWNRGGQNLRYPKSVFPDHGHSYLIPLWGEICFLVLLGFLVCFTLTVPTSPSGSSGDGDCIQT